jgi:hypothetical protein
MLTGVWNQHGFHVVNILPRGCKWTSQYDIDNILPEFCALQIAGDRRRPVIHAENARPHIPTRVKEYMEEYVMRTARDPPYSPDLAPSDFFLFGYVQRALARSDFQTAEEVLSALVRMLNAISTEMLIGTFEESIRTLQGCIDTDGQYVDSGLFSAHKLSPKLTPYRHSKGGIVDRAHRMGF